MLSDVWSVMSLIELCCDGFVVECWNLLYLDVVLCVLYV